jgi:hypothetical protein
MPGVPTELAEHTLEVKNIARPIKQKLWRFAKDRKQAIEVKVCKLLAAGFIRECKHPVWLANPVLVPKKLVDLGCVSITPTSISTTQKIPSLFLASIGSWTPQLAATYSVSLTATHDITR